MHPPRHPPAAGLIQHGGLPIQTLRPYSVSLLPRAHPTPLAPARHARRPLSRAKPGAAIDGGGAVVLKRRRLRPRRRESPGPGLPHVANTCFKCFRCFVSMFQVFHVDVAKVYWDIAYVTMIVHVFCKCMFPMFHLFFQTRVASVFI
jgi:hypothetical protein